MDSESLELARGEVIKLLRNTPLSSHDIYGLSLLLDTEAATAKLLSQMRKDGVVEMYETDTGLKYWRLTRGEQRPVEKVEEKVRLLERLALIASQDIATTLLEICDDLRRA